MASLGVYGLFPLESVMMNPYIILLVVLAGMEEEEEDAGEVGYPHHPEGGVVVDGFGEDASEEDAESHA